MIKKQSNHDYSERVATYILESMSDAVVATDLQFRIVGWNKAAEELYGWKSREVMGKKVGQVLHTQNSPLTPIPKLKKQLLANGYWKGDIIQQKIDGSLIEITSSVSVVHDKDRQPIRYVAVNRDNTERKAMEERLQYKSEVSKVLSYSHNLQESFEKIVKLAVPRMGDYCTIDLMSEEGTIDLVAMATKNNKTLMIGKKIREVLVSGKLGKIGLLKVLETGEPYFNSSILKSQIKQTVPFARLFSLIKKVMPTSLIIVPLIVQEKTIGAVTFGLSGKNRHYSASDLQIAEQISNRISAAIENVRLYERIDSEKNRLITLLSTVPGVVWEAWGSPDAAKQRIDFVSKYVEKMLGYSVEQWLTTPNFWLSIVHPDDYARAKKEASGFFESGRGGISRFRWVTKTGKSIWVESRSYVVKDKNGKHAGMRGVTMDISEHIEFDNRKDEFLGIASHELRTPLTSIKGYIQILKRLVKTQAPTKKVMDFLNRTDIYTDKLNSLINDLLDVSKIQAGKLVLNKSKFVLDDLVQESIESIQPISPKHQILYKNDSNTIITGDRDRLEQVVANLLSNAIKYSPKADKIIVSSVKLEKTVKISVRDFGIGIPKNKQSLLFQRYYRVEDTEKTFSGMGIGLYICSEIVKRHHGTISVKSNGKRGTTFEVELPIN